MSIFYSLSKETVHEVVSWIKHHPRLVLTASTVGLGLVYMAQWPRNLPPGPQFYPLFGSRHQMDLLNPHVPWMEYKQKYGDVVSYYDSGTLTVVLNSYSAIREAFISRGDDFNCRRQHGIVHDEFKDELFSGNPHSKDWREKKKFAKSALRAFGSSNDSADDKILTVMEQLHQKILSKEGEPMDMAELLKLSTANITSMIFFNRNFHYEDEGLHEVVRVIVEWYTAMNELFMLAPPFPMPLWMQKIYFRKELNTFREKLGQLRTYLQDTIEEHRKTFDKENLRDFIDVYLANRDVDEMGLTFIDTVMVFFPDSTDSIAAMLNWVVLYVTLYPDVQRRIQAELQEHVGSGRTVKMADKSKLIYTEAAILEILRINRAIVSTGEHVPAASTTFRGYNIPKGTHIYPNIYAVHFDPEIFPDPEKFDPQRFISSDGQKIINKEYVIPFGMGGRMCMGEQLTRTEIFLFTANLLLKFSTSFPPHTDAPSTQPGFGLICPPQPYNVVFTAR